MLVLAITRGYTWAALLAALMYLRLRNDDALSWLADQICVRAWVGGVLLVALNCVLPRLIPGAKPSPIEQILGVR